MNYYNNHLGVQFGYISTNTGDTAEYHSFRDWQLYPANRPVISPPKPKTMYIDVPGSDIQLDFTEALTGDVHFYNREGVFRYVYTGDRAAWESIYHDIQTTLHGKRMGVILDEEPSGYYYGRLTVGEPEYVTEKLNGTRMYINITGNFQPYRIDLLSTVDDWIWDDFDFNTGFIRDYSEIEVSGSAQSPFSLTIYGSAMPVSPVFIRTSGGVVNVYYDESDNTKILSLSSTDTEYSAPDLIVRNGPKTLTMTGTGTIQIKFQTGVL